MTIIEIKMALFPSHLLLFPFILKSANNAEGIELGPDYDFTMARIILNTNCQCLLSLRDLLYYDILFTLFVFV
jgi:hypothetical protein